MARNAAATDSPLRSIFDALRRRVFPSRTVGLALGVFDFCHRGHVNFLRRAAENCDRLIVAVHTDETVLRYKGERPANSELERARAIEDLGLADVVEVDSDRQAVCRRHRVNRVFHGDDWSRDTYENHWGRELIDELGLEIVILPHTPGLNSTGIRARTPRLGWWLYSPLASWDRSHIFDHLRRLYPDLGGTWFVSDSGRGVVREAYPDAPLVLLGEGVPHEEAARKALSFDVDVLVTAHFNYEPMLAGLRDADRPLHLVVLSHGRSGKSGTSAEVHRRHLEAVRGEGASGAAKGSPAGGLIFGDGAVTVHDYSFADDGYGHLDGFLARGGTFDNPVPATDRPRLLLLPTWGPDPEGRGLLLSRRWGKALKRLGRDWDLVLSPHPLAGEKTVRNFARSVGCEVLPARGGSFERVPEFHATLSDLSGVFWEALLFDTPAMLASPDAGVRWPDDLRPSLADLSEAVPVVGPDELMETAAGLSGQRRPGQRALAEIRLGRIDGRATARMIERIGGLLAADAEPSAQTGN